MRSEWRALRRSEPTRCAMRAVAPIRIRNDAYASLIGAAAIVRATSLMPVRSLPLQFLNPENSTDFYLANARRKVAYARAQG
jgi:hypothetical protein